MDKFITFGKPQFNKHEFNEVKNVLKSGWVGTGKKTIEFEKKFLKYINAQYGIALNSKERKNVINEAKEILDVENVIASILLVEDLRIQKN